MTRHRFLSGAAVFDVNVRDVKKKAASSRRTPKSWGVEDETE
jgi:hypothetical protein